MLSFFANYQKVKLPQEMVEAQNLLLLAVFLLLAFLTARRGEPTALLSPRQSLQLRGIVSVLVILGHLWGHVVGQRPFLFTHGETVFMFLFLSGFGLTMSFAKGHTGHDWFVRRRLIRVLVPYWIITAIILPLDRFLLGRAYSTGELVMTLAGINVTTRLNHLDYGRWYVTFLLIWYALFFLASPVLRGRGAGWARFGGSLCLFLVYRRYTFAHQFFAFPLGCLAATHYARISDLFRRHESFFFYGASAGIGAVFLFKVLLLPWLYTVIPYEEGLFLLIKEGNNLIFAVALCALMGVAGVRGWESRLLIFCGMVSYEVFLIHGALLIKYNPVFPHFDTEVTGIVPAFLVWAAALYAIAWLVHRGFQSLSKQKWSG